MNLAAQWSPEHVTLAIDLYDRHLSGQLAADEFNRLTRKNITRCAMIAKWHRLGLHGANEPKIRKPHVAEKKKVVRMSPALQPAAPGSRPQPKAEPELASLPCTILELRMHDQCRWPISDTRRFPCFYCGAAREFPGDEGRHKYCAAHGQLAYPVKGR